MPSYIHGVNESTKKLHATEYIDSSLIETDNNIETWEVKYRDDTPINLYTYPYDTDRSYKVKVYNVNLEGEIDNKELLNETKQDFIKSNIALAEGSCRSLKTHQDMRYWDYGEITQSDDHYTLEKNFGNNIWMVTDASRGSPNKDIVGKVILIRTDKDKVSYNDYFPREGGKRRRPSRRKRTKRRGRKRSQKNRRRRKRSQKNRRR